MKKIVPSESKPWESHVQPIRPLCTLDQCPQRRPVYLLARKRMPWCVVSLSRRFLLKERQQRQPRRDGTVLRFCRLSHVTARTTLWDNRQKARSFYPCPLCVDIPQFFGPAKTVGVRCSVSCSLLSLASSLSDWNQQARWHLDHNEKYSECWWHRFDLGERGTREGHQDKFSVAFETRDALAIGNCNQSSDLEINSCCILTGMSGVASCDAPISPTANVLSKPHFLATDL